MMRMWDFHLMRDFRCVIFDFVLKKDFLRYLLFGFLCYYIGLYALIRANIYYIDDYYVSTLSYSNWNHFSRFVATYLYCILFYFKDFVDISPISQFLGFLFLVLSGMILLHTIHKRFSIIGVIATLPLGLSPFFLENLSYRFDSFFMSFAVFCAVFPFLFVHKRILFVIFSILCLLLMYCAYQAANSVYILIGLYFSFYFYFTKQRAFSFLFIFCFAFVFSTLIYKFYIVVPIVDSYVNGDIASNPLNSAIHNTILYLKYIWNDLLNTQYIFLCIILAIIFVVSFARLSLRHRILSLSLSLIFVVIGLIFSYGVYVLLDKPLFEPRAFNGFGALIAIFCIVITKEHSLLSRALVVLIAINSIVFSNAYGNAIAKQAEYVNFRSQLVLNDLLQINDKNAIITLEGSIGRAYATAKFIDIYGGIADRLVPKIMIDTGWDWSYAPLVLLKMPYESYDDFCLNWRKNFTQKEINAAKILVNHDYHTIKKIGSCYIVELKEVGQRLLRKIEPQESVLLLLNAKPK